MTHRLVYTSHDPEISLLRNLNEENVSASSSISAKRGLMRGKGSSASLEPSNVCLPASISQSQFEEEVTPIRCNSKRYLRASSLPPSSRHLDGADDAALFPLIPFGDPPIDREQVEDRSPLLESISFHLKRTKDPRHKKKRSKSQSDAQIRFNRRRLRELLEADDPDWLEEDPRTPVPVRQKSGVLHALPTKGSGRTKASRSKSLSDIRRVQSPGRAGTQKCASPTSSPENIARECLLAQQKKAIEKQKRVLSKRSLRSARSLEEQETKTKPVHDADDPQRKAKSGYDSDDGGNMFSVFTWSASERMSISRHLSRSALDTASLAPRRPHHGAEEAGDLRGRYSGRRSDDDDDFDNDDDLREGEDAKIHTESRRKRRSVSRSKDDRKDRKSRERKGRSASKGRERRRSRRSRSKLRAHERAHD